MKRLVYCSLCVTLLFVSPLSALTFTDDFSNQETFFQNWLPIDSSVVLDPETGEPTEDVRPWGPGGISVVDGTLKIQTTNPVPLADPAVFLPGDATLFDTPNVGLTGAAVLSTLAEPVTDVIVRTKVRVDNNTNAAIAIRSTLATFTNYNVTASGAVGKFAISRFENGLMNRIEWFDEPSFSVGEDWWMEGSAIGDQISLRVWKVGTEEPDSPQFSWTDDKIASGGVGVAAVVQNNVVTEPTLVDATFDDFSLRIVPEPSTSMTLWCGLIGVVVNRRRKTELTAAIN